jgi:hypothetical protein
VAAKDIPSANRAQNNFLDRFATVSSPVAGQRVSGLAPNARSIPPALADKLRAIIL